MLCNKHKIELNIIVRFFFFFFWCCIHVILICVRECSFSLRCFRSISLYDIRASVPINKVVLKMRSNKAVWNPMEAFMFTAANEDYR